MSHLGKGPSSRTQSEITVCPFYRQPFVLISFACCRGCRIWICVCLCVVVTLRHGWCMCVFLLSVEGIEKHLFNLVYNWIWPMGMPCSSEKWQQMRRGWKEVEEGKRQEKGVEKEEVAYGWKKRKYTEGRKGRCRRRLREDTALHPQSSVRLQKYCVHGRVAGSQVNMTYEYCRSHSLPSCPPQLLMSGSVGSTLLKTFLSTTPENKWETDRWTTIKNNEGKKRVPTRRGHAHKGLSMQGAEWDEVYLLILWSFISAREMQFIILLQCLVTPKEKGSSLGHDHSAHYKLLQKCSRFNYLYY